MIFEGAAATLGSLSSVATEYVNLIPDRFTMPKNNALVVAVTEGVSDDMGGQCALMQCHAKSFPSRSLHRTTDDSL